MSWRDRSEWEKGAPLKSLSSVAVNLFLTNDFEGFSKEDEHKKVSFCIFEHRRVLDLSLRTDREKEKKNTKTEYTFLKNPRRCCVCVWEKREIENSGWQRSNRNCESRSTMIPKVTSSSSSSSDLFSRIRCYALTSIQLQNIPSSCRRSSSIFTALAAEAASFFLHDDWGDDRNIHPGKKKKKIDVFHIPFDAFASKTDSNACHTWNPLSNDDDGFREEGRRRCCCGFIPYRCCHFLRRERMKKKWYYSLPPLNRFLHLFPFEEERFPLMAKTDFERCRFEMRMEVVLLRLLKSKVCNSFPWRRRCRRFRLPPQALTGKPPLFLFKWQSTWTNHNRRSRSSFVRFIFR